MQPKRNPLDCNYKEPYPQDRFSSVITEKSGDCFSISFGKLEGDLDRSREGKLQLSRCPPLFRCHRLRPRGGDVTKSFDQDTAAAVWEIRTKEFLGVLLTFLALGSSNEIKQKT